MTEEQRDLLCDIIDAMYDNDDYIQTVVDYIMGNEPADAISEVNMEMLAETFPDTTALLDFFLHELANVKHAYLRDV